MTHARRAGESSNQPAIEIVRDDFPRGPFRAALFDFDGTLSLLRRDWQNVMEGMMVVELQKCSTAESIPELSSVVQEYVARLTGRQTIYQMIRLAEEVRHRGGQPSDPLEYKRRYHELLWTSVGPRIESVRQGAIEKDELVVPHSRCLLSALQDQGLKLYLSSGTDLPFVRDELAVLGLDEFFEPRVFGALDDYQKFSKELIVNQILSQMNMDGTQLIGFGDGYVEAEEVVKVGGLAVGVASNEHSRRGINAWKRDRLIRAGVQLVIGDYRNYEQLLDLLGINRNS